MSPGIALRQEGYAAELAAHLSAPGEFEFSPAKAIKYREDAERVMREFEAADLDGVLVVMLTYGPAMRVARLLSESRLPICLANIQPEPNVTPQWDMADMTYNQGVHGAQDTANLGEEELGVAHVLDGFRAQDQVELRIGKRQRSVGLDRDELGVRQARPGALERDLRDVCSCQPSRLKRCGQSTVAAAEVERLLGRREPLDECAEVGRCWPRVLGHRFPDVVVDHGESIFLNAQGRSGVILPPLEWAAVEPTSDSAEEGIQAARVSASG